MKKWTITTIILALIIATVLSACGSQQASDSDTQKGSVPETKQENTASEQDKSEQDKKEISGTIEFFTYRDDLLNTWYPQSLEEFKAKYPNVTVVTSTSKDPVNDLKIRMSANDQSFL